jgi:hypothetical protein
MPSALPTAVPEILTSPASVPLLFGLFAPSDLIIAGLTLALVVITAYYALQTRQTVEEMRRARGIAVLPRLVISIKVLGAGNGWPQITNVGPGAAIDVDARMTLEPSGPDVPWQSHVIAPDEAHELFVPNADKPGQTFYRIDELTSRWTHLHLVATYRDALGGIHRTDERVEIREWWAIVQAARERLTYEPLDEIGKELKKISGHLQTIASEARTLRQRDEPDAWVWESRVRKLPKEWQDAARTLLRRFGRSV